MCDIETLGKGYLPAIIQIAAVPFNFADNANTDLTKYGTFNQYLSLKENKKVGFMPDQDTLEWWVQQSRDALDVLSCASNSKATAYEVFGDFGKWLYEIKKIDKSLKIWGNGSLFDNRILLDAFRHLEMDVEWGYKDDMDMRTIMRVANFTADFDKTKIVKNPNWVKHDGLHDCYSQIGDVKAAYNAIKR